jgi:cephalosporin hydroxylase
MWNYQEILTDLKPALVIEFGTLNGGSALYFAETMKLLSSRFQVLSVDIDHRSVDKRARCNPRIEFLEADTTSPVVADRIIQLRREFPGNIFAIVDSDHRKQHVLDELHQLRHLTIPGDYVIVEDGNINGHPVAPGWGDGPFEALEEYLNNYPDDYTVDRDREQKFGFTFAPLGFLIRR